MKPKNTTNTSIIKTLYKAILTYGFLIVTLPALADNTDTLRLKNDAVLVGEIKSVSKNVVTFETDYSDSDFKIKWLEVKEVKSQRVFMLTLSNGQVLHASISSFDTGDNSVNIKTIESGEKNIKLSEIVDMQPFESTFLSRLDASIDFGYTYTKTNNLQQLSTRSTLGYLGNRWSGNVSFDMVRSMQDSVEPIRRTNGVINFEYYLKHNYFLLASANFLQNDEQLLALRATTRMGLGKFLVRNNRMYLALAAGGAWNNEQYTENTEPDRNSAEAFVGVTADLFNTGDLSLASSLVGYPSLTESGRFRSDFKFDVKYDLPLDFYVRLGFTINYDNQPIEGASESDYVLQTSIGWSL
ncbi:DUF481 domain-containing protein [Owenweeksia hongkongensis]|uniref:DUF481 domain-containing protein n=1 Tax=Owenweeksia hongkongensis TaxID=253245 RepID=UPI003A8EC7EB